MFSTVRLFLDKYKNRVRHTFRIMEIWRHSKQQKMSCKKCGCHIYYDFITTNHKWNKLPEKWRNTSLCINCFKEMTNPKVEFIKL